MRTIYAFIFISTLMIAASMIGLSLPEGNVVANACIAGIFAPILFVCVLLLFIKDVKEAKKKNNK